MKLSLFQMIAIPLISAFIGWFTNVLAVRMLFRPRRPINILGYKLQGLVPKRQPELAASIGHTVERHLLGADDVRRILGQADIRRGMEVMLRERVSGFVENNLKSIHPMAGMFLTGSTKQKLESLIIAEIDKMLPDMAANMIDNVEGQMDFQKIVEDKVKAFDLGKLEDIILEIAGRELRAIELLGGVLGLLIGFIQLGIMAIPA